MPRNPTIHPSFRLVKLMTASESVLSLRVRSCDLSAVACPSVWPMPRPSGGPAKHVAESSVVFALWLVQTFTSDRAVPIHHSDYQCEAQCLRLCLFLMSFPLHVLSASVYRRSLCDSIFKFASYNYGIFRIGWNHNAWPHWMLPWNKSSNLRNQSCFTLLQTAESLCAMCAVLSVVQTMWRRLCFARSADRGPGWKVSV